MRRDYDAAAGRFVSQEPSWFTAGDTNLAGYVYNEPSNMTDPSGLLPLQVPTDPPPEVSPWDTGLDQYKDYLKKQKDQQQRNHGQEGSSSKDPSPSVRPGLTAPTGSPVMPKLAAPDDINGLMNEYEMYLRNARNGRVQMGKEQQEARRGELRPESS